MSSTHRAAAARSATLFRDTSSNSGRAVAGAAAERRTRFISAALLFRGVDELHQALALFSRDAVFP